MQDNNAVRAVIDTLRKAAAGQPAGSRLPSVRALMARHSVGPETVQRAMRQLAREGVLQARPGRGTFVVDQSAGAAPRLGTRPGPPDFAWQAVALGGRSVRAEPLGELLALPRSGVIALSSGYLAPDLQPTGLLAEAAARAARRPGVWQRQPVEGLAELREWFARDAGLGVGPHDVLVCSGGQAALSTAFRALAPRGGAALFEAPTYLGALAAAHAAGLRAVPVPADADGVRPDLLASAFTSSGARVFYCQPLYANPHGAVLASDRRDAVLRAVADAGAFLIEDDYARDLHIDRAPPPPLIADDSDGHIVYVRSLTKPAAPGLRVAALIARGAAAARLKVIRMLDEFFVAGPLQETALELVTSPGWPRHLRNVRRALRERRDALAVAVRDHLGAHALPYEPSGGLHLWVALPPGTDELALADGALRADVLVTPGRHWFPAEPSAPYLRLSYAGASPPDLLAATTRLAALLHDHR